MGTCILGNEAYMLEEELNLSKLTWLRQALRMPPDGLPWYVLLPKTDNGSKINQAVDLSQDTKVRKPEPIDNTE